MKNKPQIDNYFDYREYLADLFNWFKNENSSFSHRYIVQKAGYKSPTVLKDVIDKKKNMTTKSIERFSKALKLNEYESEYLKILLRFNTTESLSEKDKYFNELTLIRKKNPGKKLSVEEFEVLEKWWTPAIKELLSLPDYKHSKKWMARVLEPEIKVEEVSKALNVLERNGLIKKENSQWIPVDEIIKTDREVKSLKVAKYHEQMMNLAKKAMYNIPSNKREYSGTLIRISKDDVNHIKNILYDVRQTILSIAEKSKEPDQIYQLNFQLFPLIKTDRGNRLNSSLDSED